MGGTSSGKLGMPLTRRFGWNTRMAAGSVSRAGTLVQSNLQRSTTSAGRVGGGATVAASSMSRWSASTGR